MKKLCWTAAGVALTGFSAFGAGFALYEGSASGTALGGAVMGKAVDASALFYNPATMSDFTNVVVTAGFVTEHPTADTAINGHHGRKMDPGAFVLPHAYAVVPLPYDFSFGLGFAPEFGLGTHYNQDWEMAWNTRSTFVEGLTLNPNISYRITDKWSVAAGIRLLYFKFDQYSSPQAVSDGNYYGSMRNHLKGDNGFTDWGWELSTRYRFTDTISAGVLYKSYIDTKVKGYNHTRVRSRDYSAAEAQAAAAARKQLTDMGLVPGVQPWDVYYAQAIQRANAQAHQMVDSSLDSAARGRKGKYGRRACGHPPSAVAHHRRQLGRDGHRSPGVRAHLDGMVFHAGDQLPPSFWRQDHETQLARRLPHRFRRRVGLPRELHATRLLRV